MSRNLFKGRKLIQKSKDEESQSNDEEERQRRQQVEEYREERMREIFKSSDQAMELAIMQGKASEREIKKFNQVRGKKRSRSEVNDAEAEAAERIAQSNEFLNTLIARAQRRSRSRSPSPSTIQRVYVPPPSKRRKTVHELKARLNTPRSTREGCVPRCISRDSHELEWEGKEQDLKAFDHFVYKSLTTTENLTDTCRGNEMQTAYEIYAQEYEDMRKLSPQQLGRCCEVRFCKTNPSRFVHYHGVQSCGV